jgi:hypothetical protein
MKFVFEENDLYELLNLDTAFMLGLFWTVIRR